MKGRVKIDNNNNNKHILNMMVVEMIMNSL